MSKATLLIVLDLDSTASNMVEWEREFPELWTLGMSDSTYLVASLPRRLVEGC